MVELIVYNELNLLYFLHLKDFILIFHFNRFEKKKEFLFTLLTEWVRKCKKKLQIFHKKNCENPHPSQWIFFSVVTIEYFA